MKTPLKDKFKTNVKVRPLYRNVKSNRVQNTKKSMVTFEFDNKFKLCGDARCVKHKIVNDRHVNYNLVIKNRDNDALPGICEVNDAVVNRTEKVNPNQIKTNNGLTSYEIGNHKISMNDCGKGIENQNNKSIQNAVNVADFWLRVYPASQSSEEAVTSIIVRCLFCQLGLAVMLILWTILWVFFIQSFEEPYETEVSLVFEKQQNQLVIDLATELRQITPLSPKWKEAIEKRIEDERHLTMEAIGRGAKLRPGQFWDLSGTFLFAVYVMTALGFGAPVPKTLWGRTLALVYALLAVPTHFYLMINAAKCVIYNIDRLLRRRSKTDDFIDMEEIENRKEECNYSGNDRIIKCKIIRRKIYGFINILCAGQCVPLAAVMYYTCGAIGFGLLRGKTDLELFLFPLEFTTSGRLEEVKDYVRILYSFYVEGAMFLLACALASLRRRLSGDAAVTIAEHYRLYTYVKK